MFAQFRAELDGVPTHFVHERARRGSGIPLILTNGWPSTFVELLPLVPLLTDPQAHGIDGPAFDVVIPSLPGYGFSERPARTGVNYRYNAAQWHHLMRGLGYERYGAQGGDFGAGVSTVMALDDPEPMIGIHLNNLEISPFTGPGSRPLSEAERTYLEHNEAWWVAEGGYKAIQATKPQTLGYGLNDSPADPGEVEVVGRYRGRPRPVTFEGLPAGDRDDLLGHTDNHAVDSRLLRQQVDRDHARPAGLRRRANRGRRLRPPVRLGRRASSRVGRTPLQRPPVDANAERRALRCRRGAGAPRRDIVAFFAEL